MSAKPRCGRKASRANAARASGSTRTCSGLNIFCKTGIKVFIETTLGIHFLVKTQNAEECKRNSSERLGWLGWQLAILASLPQFETEPPSPNTYPLLPRVKLRFPAVSGEIVFGRLGYTDAAKASYADFSRLKQAGVIPAACRFQVSLPTPLAPINVFVAPQDKGVVEPPYEARLLAELDEIATAIPHDE